MITDFVQNNLHQKKENIKWNKEVRSDVHEQK